MVRKKSGIGSQPKKKGQWKPKAQQDIETAAATATTTTTGNTVHEKSIVSQPKKKGRRKPTAPLSEAEDSLLTETTITKKRTVTEMMEQDEATLAKDLMAEFQKNPIFKDLFSEFLQNYYNNSASLSAVSSLTATEGGTTASTTPVATTPAPPYLTRKTRKDLIPLDERSFCYYKDGSIRGTGELGRGTAATKAENRAVLGIVNVVNNPKLSDRQKVHALRKASTHHLSRRIFHSAGLIDDKKYKAMKHSVLIRSESWFKRLQQLMIEEAKPVMRKGHW